MKIIIQGSGNATHSGCTDSDTPLLSGSAATVSGVRVTLDGSPDLSACITTPGDAQWTIALAQATNANRKIFKIIAFDNTAKWFDLDAAPTGVTSSGWVVGGRITIAGFAGQELSAQGGDEVVFNEDITGTAVILSPRGSGTQGEGYIRYTGAAGAIRTMENTGSGSASIFTESGTTAGIWYRNLRFSAPNGTSGSALSMEAANVAELCEFDGGSAGGTTGITFAAAGNKLLRCQVEGFGVGVSMSTFGGIVAGCYIHHNTDGITFSGSSFGIIAGNVITKNTQYGVHFSGAVSTFTNALGFFANNTVAWNGADGLRIADVDAPFTFANNIFAFNGTTSGYNINLTPGGNLARQAFCSHNILFATGGGANVNGYTLQATDINADPLFTDADADSDDYSLQASSPAKAAAMPLFGFSSYLDIGAIQRQEPTGGGGTTGIAALVGGGLVR